MPFTIGPKIHNIVSRELKRLIEDFFALQDWEGIYLTGGTCLAEYYFGHRLSEDLDLFTQDRHCFREAQDYLKDPKLFSQGVIKVVRTTHSIAQFLYSPHTGAPIKVDLVMDIPQRIHPSLSVGPVWVDDLDDILSNKIGCLISRNEVKDYLDLYQLIPASHLTMGELIQLGQIKEAGLDPLILANQIEFILQMLPPQRELLGKADWVDLQFFFKKIQKECLEIIRPNS